MEERVLKEAVTNALSRILTGIHTQSSDSPRTGSGGDEASGSSSGMHGESSYVTPKRCQSRPSIFLNKNNRRPKKTSKPPRKYSYDRDIICLPSSYSSEDGLIKIPRKKSSRDFLAVNKLFGKVRLNSCMSENDIMTEIRSVFREPMGFSSKFPFKILQSSGCGSKSLIVPVLSDSFQWTASVVAGKNSKTPIYIIAEEDLSLLNEGEINSDDDACTLEDDAVTFTRDERTNQQTDFVESKRPRTTSLAEERCEDIEFTSGNFSGAAKDSKEGSELDINKAVWKPHSTYDTYIDLVSDSEDEGGISVVAIDSPLSPPFSPLSQPEDKDKVADQVSKIIENNRVKYLPEDRENYSRILIRRKHLLEDALKQCRHLQEKKHLRVTFVGEPAVDEGGPLREFFHLSIYEIGRSNALFVGDGDKRIPRHSVVDLQNKVFFTIGKLFALSIMHGGPGPSFLAKSVIQYILFDRIEGDISDVPDTSVKNSLMKLQAATSLVDFRRILDSSELSFRFDGGVSTPSHRVKSEDQTKVLQSVTSHYTIYSVKAEIDQIRDGLCVMGVLELLIDNAALMMPLLVPYGNPKLTAEHVIRLFEVNLSPQGSNIREDEEEVSMRWIQYLQMIEDYNGKVKAISHNGKEVEMDISYENILLFATGAPREPPLKFNPQPSVSFHKNNFFPSSHTCTNTMLLPLGVPSFEEFVYYMTYGIMSTAGFGHI